MRSEEFRSIKRLAAGGAPARGEAHAFGQRTVDDLCVKCACGKERRAWPDSPKQVIQLIMTTKGPTASPITFEKRVKMIRLKTLRQVEVNFSSVLSHELFPSLTPRDIGKPNVVLVGVGLQSQHLWVFCNVRA